MELTVVLLSRGLREISRRDFGGDEEDNGEEKTEESESLGTHFSGSVRDWFWRWNE